MNYKNEGTEHDINNTTSGSNEGNTKPSVIFSSTKNNIDKQLLLTLSLVNLLLLTSITALILKFSWMGLMAIIAVF